MEWEWEPEQRDLGGLGIAGVCRETSRVVFRVILPNFTNLGPPLLAALLVASAAALRALCYYTVDSVDPFHDDGSNLRFVAGWAACILLDIVILWLLRLCTAAYVFCVASLYCTGGDLLAADRVLKDDLPVVPLTRLDSTFLLVEVPFFLFLGSLCGLAFLRVEIEIILPLPLRLLGWAIGAYGAVLFQLACVVSVLEEDAALFGAVRRSWKLLAGKFWPAACVFVTLDGCIVAVLKAFTALVLDDALGLGVAFQVAAAATMFVALCEVIVVTLVAQPVVYMVCKSHHQEVVDMAHLKSTKLAVDGDN
jgi:hypothetical protein